MSIPRPRFHFTPAENFINDPNGLVWHAGEYHMFYQLNPFGAQWGHMSWGHAVSRDLVHWEHLPVALAEDETGMIFSGSAVVDREDTSGFASDGEAPLVAVYTSHSDHEQTQNIAYSTDRGRTWTKYAGNPVLSIGSREFRDPKVFWHGPTSGWIMVTVLADQHKVRFDASPDLKTWTHLSDFGPAGAVDGLWECPDFFPLQVEGQPGVQKWVLKVDALKGTGAQYFVGEFDGARFINDAPADLVLRLDFGADFYAAQSWNDEPHGRRIWIGWLNNWYYANQVPTSPWRGVFSIPRRLGLRQYDDGLRLVQRPIPELARLRKPLLHIQDGDVSAIHERLAPLNVDLALEIKAEFVIEGTDDLRMVMHTGEAEETIVGYDAAAQELFVDRRRAGDSSFSSLFADVHRAPLAPEQGKIGIHIFMDSCSLEVFGNDGRVVISDLIFPRSPSRRLAVNASGGSVRIPSLEVWQLA